MASDLQAPLAFTLGNRTVVANRAQRLDHQRELYRLEINPPSIDHIGMRPVRSVIQGILRFCPWLKVLRPGWLLMALRPDLLLPSTIILKRQKKGRHDEFETERHAYHILESLQGSVISYFLGEASYNGVPALIFSEIQGQTLQQIARPEDGDLALENRLESAYKRLNELGVIHGDAELHNIFDDGQRVMLVDFEFAEFNQHARWEDSSSRGDVGNVMDEYRRRRSALLNWKVTQ